MAHLAQLQTAVVHGSYPVIGKIDFGHLFTVNCIEMMKILKKRPSIAE